MRWIGRDTAPFQTRKGWNRHLKSIRRIRKQNIYKHVRKFGPISKEGRTQRAQSLGYLLEYFRKLYRPTSKKIHRLSSDVYIPENFCFIEHPEEALRGIWNAVDECLFTNNKRIRINHTRVQRYNLTSEALLGIGTDAGEQWRRIKKRKINITGTLPNDTDHRQLLLEIGIVSDLKATANTPRPYSTEKQHLFEFKSIKKSTPSPHSEDDKTIASEKFSQHVNECINDHNLELTEEAITSLMKSVSEVLDNAERHSTLNNTGGHIWFARGYLNSHSKQQNFEISIFNFGMTIAETFLALPPENYSRQLVSDYSDEHIGEFSQEQLITIAALQQRYSCKNRTARETNGQGTVVLIQFFEQLCEQFSETFGITGVKPMMSIISGQTHIIFDGTYRLSQLPNYTDENTDDEQLIIAFNEQNSLKSPPDPRFVKKLENAFFPGVAISIRFPLKEEDDE